MEVGIDIRYVRTKDDLRLQGIHYDSGRRDACVLFIHGMTGNFIENYFGHVLGQLLASNGIGFIYSHNRGYNFVNDIATSKKTADGRYVTRRYGGTYELIEDCVFDIEVWIEEIFKLGYKKVILMGHSLGCNKIVYFLNKTKAAIHLTGIILASPPDMVGASIHDSGSLKKHEKLVKEARENVKLGNPRKLLDGFIWGGWMLISSQTFLDASVDYSPGDIFPIMRNPEVFPELSTIKHPILCLVGEKDGVLLKPVKEYFDILESKAIGCPNFTRVIVKGANHTYDFQERQFADRVLKWVVKLTNS